MSTAKLLAKARIVSNEKVVPGHFVLTLEAKELVTAIRPGQFAHLSCGTNRGVILRRPFSFYDIEGEKVLFLYQVVGKGTGLLSQYIKGEELSLLGPLGRGFWYENNARKKIIIAGGVGIAPFPLLIKEMIFKAKIPPADIIVIYGARGKNFFVGLEKLRGLGVSLYLSTDMGDEGFKGTTIDFLSTNLKKGGFKSADYFTCGPERMMERIAEIVKEQGGRVQVCLEERMACGLGACLSCVKKINGHYLRVCKDGPIFWGDEVEW